MINNLRLKKEYILKEELTEKEKEILLETWKKNNMTDLNHWLQLVNCEVEYCTKELDPSSTDLNI